MLRGLTARQFAEWMAYAELEPFDERRGDYRAAQVVTALANINRDAKRTPTPYKIEDFLLDFDGERRKPKQTWQDHKRILTAIANAFSRIPDEGC